MLAERTPRSVESSEGTRAFVQARVALLWKVIFLVMLFSSAMGAVGAMKSPGVDLAIDLALAAESGALWLVLRRGQRSARFSHRVEVGGLVVFFAGASLLGRYVLIGFASDHSIATAEGALMADAYFAVLGLVGAALVMMLRAALIPSSPRRTLIYTAAVGVPSVLAPTLLVPGGGGGLAVRAPDSAAYPWLPVGLVIVWTLVVFTSTVVSRVIYGLRTEVREAKRMGQYVIDGKIGEGGMGEVYRAHHSMMRRPSALKLVRADRAHGGNLVRFEREVQLTARLTHPNTITIFDYGRTHDGVFYYAMELLDGANLQRIVEVGGPQDEGRVVRILTMACGALAEAHAIGLIHRDIKPANIMLCTQGGERDVVKLLDFGLVKELAVDGDPNLSGAATLTGTPHYMAPESILEPEALDARADIYALGAVAYFLLTGREVFAGKTIVEVLSLHLYQDPEPMSARGVSVSPELEAIVHACLAKEPAGRPQSAGELRHRLEACAARRWESEDAETWWLEHHSALEGGAPVSAAETHTIAIDGRARTPITPRLTA